MEAFALYLFRSVIWISGFAMVFLLFLRNERFFALNRLFLVSGILTSFFFPLISVHYIVDLPAVGVAQATGTIVNGFQAVSYSNKPDVGLLLFILYLSGVSFVSFMKIRQSISVISTIKKSEIITYYPAKLIRTADYAYSFSFFSYVFVNPSITDVETKEIVNHELVHIRQRHWFDLVLVELLCMMQWFNPFIWIYVRFIRQNHEYLADEVALQRTADPAIYRATLLNQIVGSPVVSLTNSFNYSLNKKRFNMMKKIISSPYRKMKIFLILPVIALVLFAFAKPEYRYTSINGKFGDNDTLAAAITKEVKGTVVQQNGSPLQGATILITNTSRGVSADAKGWFKLDNVPEEGLLVVTYVGFKSIVVKPVFTSEMTIKMIRDTVKYLNANISTPPPPPPPPSLSPSLPPPPPPPPPPPSLVVVDGTISDIDVNKIDPQSIESIKVLKDKFAVEKYGEKGKNGAIEVTTKKNNSFGIGKVVSDIKATGSAGDQKTDKNLFVIVEEMPEFPGGGKEAMINWIIQNLKYPGNAVKGKITGKVFVDFLVSRTGKVKDVQVINPVHPLLDAEAKRVISNMPDWKPGSQAGKPVDVQIKVPVEFRLQ